jgi:hypothetical protein
MPMVIVAPTQKVFYYGQGGQELLLHHWEFLVEGWEPSPDPGEKLPVQLAPGKLPAAPSQPLLLPGTQSILPAHYLRLPLAEQ